MKYYLGLKRQSQFIFRSRSELTDTWHPEGLVQCFGPFPTRRAAESRAMNIPMVLESGHGYSRYPIQEWPRDFR